MKKVVIVSSSQATEVSASNQFASLKSHTEYFYGEATWYYVWPKTSDQECQTPYYPVLLHPVMRGPKHHTGFLHNLVHPWPNLRSPVGYWWSSSCSFDTSISSNSYCMCPRTVPWMVNLQDAPGEFICGRCTCQFLSLFVFPLLYRIFRAHFEEYDC